MVTRALPSDAPRILDGLSALAGRYDAIFCDVWGVIHNGRARFPAACEALSRFREAGGTVILITNAPRPSRPILEQLAGLQVPRTTFDGMVTSGDVTLGFIEARRDAPLHHIGPERDLTLFQVAAEQTGVVPRLVPLPEAAYVVVTGLFDDQTETPDTYAGDLELMRARGLDMISANPDLVVHVGDQLIYCAGALAQAYEARGGHVLQAGKPFSPIYERALEMASASRGKAVTRDRILAIGDAMRTDITGAGHFGIDSLFITSGIHRDELHPGPESRPDLDLAAYAQFLDTADVTPTLAMPELIW
ncbi:MAG: HAD-superfamily hydrolase, subfamily [Hyphomicrobiales bacterium]|nr:HAD-superfamily hydrolase, subfamily [Hyphomicrobiales bacterium]